MMRGYTRDSLSSLGYLWPFVVLASCPSYSDFSTSDVVPPVLVRGEGSLHSDCWRSVPTAAQEECLHSLLQGCIAGLWSKNVEHENG